MPKFKFEVTVIEESKTHVTRKKIFEAEDYMAAHILAEADDWSEWEESGEQGETLQTYIDDVREVD